MQHELRNNDLILRDYGHLKYRKIDDPRPERTLESDEDWQTMNCVLDNGVGILSCSRGQKIRGVKHRQHRPSLIVADDVEDLDWVRTQENRDKSDRWYRGNVRNLLSFLNLPTDCVPVGRPGRALTAPFPAELTTGWGLLARLLGFP